MPRTPTTFRTPRVAARRIMTSLALIVGVAACRDAAEYPEAWAPLQAPAKPAGPDSTAAPTCPDLRGTYRLDDKVVFGNLVERQLTREQREIGWLTFGIAPRGADSLDLIVTRGNIADTVTVATRDKFRCADGWLTAPWPEYLLRETKEDGFDDDRTYTRQLWVTRDQQGHLIGREDIVSYGHLFTWCYDGCHDILMPGTRREEVRWHRVATPELFMRITPEPEGDPEVNARVAREDAALEAGEPPPPR